MFWAADDPYYHSVFDTIDKMSETAAGDAATTIVSAIDVGAYEFAGTATAPGDGLSHHPASRQETGRLLASGACQVLEFRAGMVIAEDSASFRMLNDLVKRLPVMVTPEWVRTKSQPIGVDDVLTYLARGREVEVSEHHAIVEIGGADVVSYRDMMQRVAGIRGRSLSIVTVPVLTPRLSSLWCGLVTSVPTSIARPLIDGLVNETVVRDDAAARLFPDVRPIGFDEAVRVALGTA